jgi:hypothetical protein
MSTSLRTLTFSLTLVLSGCPSSNAPADVPSLEDTGGPDAPALEDTGADLDAPTGLDAPAADAPLADAGSPCAYADAIDRSCTTDADCLVRLHQTDCCGNAVMIGIRTSALGAYNAGEPACMASYPACGCPAGLPTTDSGETVTDLDTVQAACVSRGPRDVCQTYVTMRPADGR